MTDNVSITPGTGANIAADEINGVMFQRVKATFGVDGTAVDVSSANPLPVTAPTDFPDASGLAKLEAVRSLLAAGIPVSGAFWPTTQPVSVSTLPLPSNASTESTLAQVRDRLPSTPPSQPLTDTQLRATAVPVSMAGASTESTLASLLDEFQSRIPQIIAGGMRLAGYDPGDDMLKVKSVQKKFRDSFVGSTLNAAKWESSIGSGGNITVGSGVLTLAPGTTANSQTWVLTKETFTVPFRVNIGLTLSQRIANQSFIVEAVSVDPATGIPDGLHAVGLVFDGATATQAKYRVQNSGATALDSSAVTFPTTASGGFFEIEPFADEAWFHGGTLDSSSGRANSYRRHQQIPEPNAVFKLRLRWLNGSSAPASSTNAVVQYISVQDYAELTAEITAGRGNSVAGQALAAAVVSMPTVTANIGTVGPTMYTDSVANLAVSATFTGTSRDAGTTPAYQRFVASAIADQAGTLKIQRSTDATTWRDAAIVAVAANVPAELTALVTARYHRVLFVNGTTAQTLFLLTSAYMRIG